MKVKDTAKLQHPAKQIVTYLCNYLQNNKLPIKSNLVMLFLIWKFDILCLLNLFGY